MTDRTCSLSECDSPHLARGFCKKHYQRWVKYGDPNQVAVIMGDDERRFWSKVERGDGCWLWTGGVDKNGYGVMQVQGKVQRATRLSWYFAHGEFPPAHLYACHSCDTPPCVNPAHLWLGTNDENMADCTAKGRRPSGDRNGTHTTPESVRRGDAHGSVKITFEQVQQLRAEYERGVPSSQLARRYGLSHGYVNRLVRGDYRSAA